jgi:hypothetical protein
MNQLTIIHTYLSLLLFHPTFAQKELLIGQWEGVCFIGKSNPNTSNKKIYSQTQGSLFHIQTIYFRDKKCLKTIRSSRSTYLCLPASKNDFTCEHMKYETSSARGRWTQQANKKDPSKFGLKFKIKFISPTDKSFRLIYQNTNTKKVHTLTVNKSII